MKLKLLLFSMFISGVLYSQITVCDYPNGVYTSLIITEARFTSRNDAYVEITNMGDEAINLSEFKFGVLANTSVSYAIRDLCNDPWGDDNRTWMFLPDRILMPKQSFVLTYAYDYLPVHYKNGLGRQGGAERPKQVGMYEVADKLIHISEPISGIQYESDSVNTQVNDPEQLTPTGENGALFAISITKGRTMYLQHHYTEGDSVVIDQVGGVFDNNGRNMPLSYDIAGVQEGLGNSIVIRKAYITKGTIDFANARGINLEDSEWIPIQLPEGYNAWRDIFWTIGNHGNYQLDENILEPVNDAITVDYAAKMIIVPWGIRRLDDIMRYMKKKPGMAWTYDLNPIEEDSLYRSARSGDLLTIHVVGNTLQSATFILEVLDPTVEDNIVIPIDHSINYRPGSTGPITTRTQNGILNWPRVTRHDSGVDTITGSGYGIPFDLRTDSLLKYLEKPNNATWEFVWVDGVERADLKNGDKLKVISENGKEKEYFIQVVSYWPSTDAELSAITWPDIPDFYHNLFGWKGDTIPNFSPTTTYYQIEVPFDVEEIPALIAKTNHINATVKVNRARSLSGTLTDRTISFEVTAEDDTIHKLYHVELKKEITSDKIEPFFADPFISEFVNAYPPGCVYLEIFNPGNQPLDLRNYMVGMTGTADYYHCVTYKPAWGRRYKTYIPGLKHVDQHTWNMTPKMMVPDPNVNPFIPGKGTFVLANITRGNNHEPGLEDYYPEYNVQFSNQTVSGIGNPWNEATSFSIVDGLPIPPNGNRKNGIFLYKILNDSIIKGLKAIEDPNDFKVIDVWGMPDMGYWVVGGHALNPNQVNNLFIRKPEISKGNPELGASFGSSDEDCEWIEIQPNVDYKHIPFPERYGIGTSNLNQHYMIEPTYYKSTINSIVYKVSDGFGPDENILGLKEGVTVDEFLSKIIKEDDGQVLKAISATDGSELGMDAVLKMNDKLEVVSADGNNTTIYRLDVTKIGLNNNAYLSSSRWNIQVSVDPTSADETTAEEGIGSISGFDYGTTLKTVVDNVKVPVGATLTIVDGDGAYVPYTTLNFDTTYVSVTVNTDIFFEVVAEDNITRLVYQLQPSTSVNDAFILSDVYEVSQPDNLIHFVPRGTNFQAFLSNIIPSLGASLKLIDKMGFERVYGNIREDDKVVVTSANGLTTRVYYISFLPTSTIPQTTYLAYVLSEAYIIDQVDYQISAGLAALTSETLLHEFTGYLIPSMGATITVVDKNGEVKTSGDLNDGDKLVVTSANGKIVTTYTLALDLTTAGAIGKQQHIAIFPNPASNRLNIQGVEAGNRIQIFSAAGALVREVKAQSSLEMISLEQVPSGMIMIVVSDDQLVLGRFKAIRN